MDLSNLRRDYEHSGLNRKDLDPNPFNQFDHWFEQARQTDISDPTAMSLATADEHGVVGIRTVLLKYYDDQGFVFFTNYNSLKARHISANANVALLFPWLKLDRQVRISGQAERVPASESLKYFLSRPRGSQLGAWVSQQSSVISSRAMLMAKLDEIRQRFADGNISLPEFWGGYRVKPLSIEFWQGRPDRLHDRFQYSREDDGGWRIERLAP